MPYSNMLLCLHCHDDEKHVVEAAVRLKTMLKARLSVVVVNDPGAGKAHMLMDTLPRCDEKDVRRQLEKFGYPAAVGEAAVISIDSKNYPRAIARATRDFDLLIMGHHPKNPLLAFLKDSTDERVIDRIDCPVLLVPLPGAESGEINP